ncbi:MAG: penicillin acylase family protein [Sulfolobales archaeon]
MSIFKETLAAVISLILIILITMSLGSVASLMNPYSGVWTEIGRGDFRGEVKISIKGLDGETVILFDKYMIPHIFASSDRDAAYALGYVHAYHRLWQMDIQRRLAEGRLSEILGISTLKQDIFMRIVGLYRSAVNTTKYLESSYPEVYSILKAYAEGVNKAIYDMRSSRELPIMFKLLGYEPEPWKPEDSIAWSLYMAWELTNFFEPLKLTYLAIKLGPEDTNILFPIHPYYADNVTVIPGNGSIDAMRINKDPEYLRSLNWFSQWATGIDLSDQNLTKQILDAIESILDLSGEKPASIGSNNWVVGPSRSAVGGAMLADDPHLSLNIPAVWYEAHIKTPDMNVRGVTLPGIPFIIIGFNEYIAWGLTNTQIGVMDFYLEKISNDSYYYKGEWRPLKIVEEPIKVKGYGIYTLKVNITANGPIMSTRGAPISFRWVGNAGYMNDDSGITRQSIAIYLVNKARSYKELIEALRYWDVPSQNWAFIDRENNYGIIIPGLFPYRSIRLPDGDMVKVVGSRSILNGSGGYEWEGYIPYEQIPRIINPQRGWAAAPNQMSVGPYYPYFILGAWWDPGARAQRIFQLLSSKDRHSVEDMMRYQADIYLWYASSTTPLLIRTLEKFRDLDPIEIEALKILASWDYRMGKDLVAPTIWWAWFSALYDEVFSKIYLDRGINLRFYPSEDAMIWLIQNMPNSKWFGGNLSEVFRRAFSKALNTIKSVYGDDINSWTWGRIHMLYIAHLSGLKPLSIGPIPEDGASATLMNAGFSYDLRNLGGGTYVRTGPSWRIVAYVEKGSIKAYGIYPGGQSENPFSNYYKNFFNTWYNYSYRELDLPTSPDTVEDRIALIIMIPG